MKKNKQLHIHFRSLLAVVLILLLTMGYTPMVKAADTSGTCGNNVNWTLENGTLTISGSGNMNDYGEFSPAPWDNHADQISTVRVENGVTSVGSFAFFRLDKVTKVTLADSVTEIGGWAFYGCSALEILDLGGFMQTISDSAFELCYSLRTVRLPEGLKTLGDQAFYRCESLVSITIPSSVTTMGTEVFTYCKSLQNAVILADIPELPRWTFYGCTMLSGVTMTPKITSVDEGAFEKCDNLPDSFVTSDKAEDEVELSSSSTVQQENGDTVTTDKYYSGSQNGDIFVESVKTQNESGSTVKVQVDAVLEDKDGWENMDDVIDDVLSQPGSVKDNAVDATVNLMNDTVVSGKDISRFAGKDVKVTIHTSQGATWHFNGKDIARGSLTDDYDLSFTLTALTEPDEAQAEVLGGEAGYLLSFHSDLDFKVEVELPLGEKLARETAVFFALVEEEGYQRMQSVVIDGHGIAHFYLAQVQAGVEYLIGINVPASDDSSPISDAIIPEVMQNEYPKYEQVEEIKYVVTGVKSSWGMNLNQVMWILAGVMGGTMIVVGVVVYIIFKRKLKQGYVPDMSYADEKK